MRTRVKICGITNEADLASAVASGADAVGFNLYEKSPRYVDASKAAALIARTPAFVTTVGLFANHSAEQVTRAISTADFDLLQFHGDEPESLCVSFGRRYIKAVRVGEDTDLVAIASRYTSSSGLLLDAKVPGLYGGSGVSFDWSAIPKLDQPIIVAGGLNPANVGDAIATVQPWGVDVSTGVEAGKGIKDSQKIEAFMAAVKAADGEAV